jgi:hypothetical protein
MLMSESFTKLFSTILSSTVWNEDADTRLVWITMLALADRRGYVGASIPGLAHQARVSLEAAESAVKKLSSPDTYSRTKTNEGRRITETDRGWLIVNYSHFRGLRDEDARRDYERDRKREKRAEPSECLPVSAGVCHGLPPSAQADADREADPEQWGSNQIEDQHNTEVRTGADRARAENPPNGLAVWNPNGRAVHSPNSLAANRHLRCHPAGMAACQRGICIPAFLVQQWTSQLDPDQTSPAPTEQSVRTFIAAVLSGLPKGPIGDDPLKFWRAQWERAHGSQAPASKPKTRSDRMVESGQEVLAARQARREAKLAAGRAQ